MVSRGVPSDLHKDKPDVLSNSLFRYIMSGSGLKTLFKELHILIPLPFLGLPGLEAPLYLAHKSLHYIAFLG